MLSELQVLRLAYHSLLLVIFWRQHTLTASACIFGMSILHFAARLVQSDDCRRANRAQYTDISFRSITEEDMERVNFPSVNGSAEDEGLTGNISLLSTVEDFFAAVSHLSNLVVHDQPQDVLGSVPDIDDEVVTLTLLPRSRWQTLLNLDVIQVRIARVASCFAYSTDLNFSAETSQKSLQKPRRRHPFSYPHFQELKRASWFRRKERKRRRRVDRKNQPQLPKVSFQKNYHRNQRREIVGVASITTIVDL